MAPEHFHSPMGALARLSSARSRSISPENFTGEKGKGGMATIEDMNVRFEKMATIFGTGAGPHPAAELGQGWKISPMIVIGPHETFTIADIDGPGAIQHIWLTPTTKPLVQGEDERSCRFTILRIDWSDQ